MGVTRAGRKDFPPPEKQDFFNEEDKGSLARTNFDRLAAACKKTSIQELLEIQFRKDFLPPEKQDFFDEEDKGSLARTNFDRLAAACKKNSIQELLVLFFKTRDQQTFNADVVQYMLWQLSSNLQVQRPSRDI